MIITITGKPCSGKGTVAKEFCKKYNFEYVCTGDMFRKFAKELGYSDILAFQTENSKVKDIDKLVDEKIYEIGKTKSNENIVIDSRLAWNFIPNSFKVFIDVDDTIAGKRLLEANRETEQANSLDEAIESLQTRWKVENDRYLELYGVNNLTASNYDYVVDSSTATPLQMVEKIYEKFKIFNKNSKRLVKNNKK